MSFIPIIVMNGILLALVVLLSIADKLLVNYGECKITVSEGDDENVFTVEGGGNLLSCLTDNGVEISSSCGGKGTCGYCKVRVVEGGGQILPTEEIFMSRKEKLENMRLACQVKIKNDMRIVIPDYLTIVREMVVNEKFDPERRWLVSIY